MPDAVPPPVELQRLRWWHLPEVLAIEQEVFGPESWTPALYWSELAQAGSLLRPRAATRYYVVAVARGHVRGYAGLAVGGDPELDGADVQTIAVAPDAQGTGLGRRLLRALIEEADARGAGRVHLEVRADEPVARGLYESEGFVTVGRRRGYYQPSNADALTMVRRRGGGAA
ncbi:MAG: ribosomal-protein-alanine acetyltransferase [Mycobacterium sp.]|nr:ribosomal-protein-alanine acetyltransferase [Mycobacterium sp.]